jgi:2-succinyl-6-hydroxy-2,4-cyclohexadiene-1-carboxylate synthase
MVDPLPLIRYGPEEGRPVLFLHGFMGAAANWRPVMERSDDARSLAVDLPGHGAATGRPERAYTMEGCVAALEATLRFENVRSCAVVGYSMGGRLALSLRADAARALPGAAP